jgi:2-dehydro-3-deoxygluconokinase
VLVTDGARGCDVVTPDGVEHVAARDVRRDPTGAGDAFAAAYLASRAQGHTPVSAARRATAIVAAVLTR